MYVSLKSISLKKGEFATSFSLFCGKDKGQSQRRWEVKIPRFLSVPQGMRASTVWLREMESKWKEEGNKTHCVSMTKKSHLRSTAARDKSGHSGEAEVLSFLLQSFM